MRAFNADIAYFEARLEESIRRSKAAEGPCAKAVHDGLAHLYRLELMQLETVGGIASTDDPVLSQAREAGVISANIIRAESCPDPKRQGSSKNI